MGILEELGPDFCVELNRGLLTEHVSDMTARVFPPPAPLPTNSVHESHSSGKSIVCRRPRCGSPYVNLEGESINILIPISKKYGWIILLSPGRKQDPAEKDTSQAYCDGEEEWEKPGERCVVQGHAQARLRSAPSPKEKQVAVALLF